MKRIIMVVLVSVLTMTMAACDGRTSNSADEKVEGSKASDHYGFGDFMADEGEAEFGVSETPTEDKEDGGNAAAGLSASLNREEVKLIFSADMRVQTLDFEKAEEGLYSLVEKAGGYFEDISWDNGSLYRYESGKYASYTVRVPSDKYQKFISTVSDGMHVVSMSQNAQDVGQMYFDAERRLETLKVKHDRLEELLSNAAEMTDIIQLEEALSDTEYQIEEYTSDIQRYDSLIDYSRVTICIEKVKEYDTGISEELTFSQRLTKSVKQGASDFGRWLGGMADWIGYHIIQLVIMATVIMLTVKLHLVSRIKGLYGSKRTQKYMILSNIEEREESK